MTLIERAEKYEKTICGSGLKSEPNLNKYIPDYMRDAFEAGFRECQAELKGVADALRDLIRGHGPKCDCWHHQALAAFEGDSSEP